MRWLSGTLRDLVSLQRGHDLPEYRRQRGSVPVVGSAGPNGFHNEARQRGPGVTIGRSGASIGHVTYVAEDYWPHNTCLYVTDFKGNNPRYVAYLLGTLNLRQLNSGAAQPSLNRNFVYSLKIRFPKPEQQDQIASTLSAYDDPIENNRRRIQLLEQAARLIYKEWFVRLRFPGHERVKVKDGVPEGWERKTIGSVAPFQYGKALKKDDRVPGPYAVYGSSGVVGTHEKALVNGPGIIVGRKGNVGSVFWSESDFHPIDTVYYIKSEHCTTYLYYALLNTQFINTDVAVPGLNRDFAHSRELPIPDATVLAFFEEHITVIRDQVDQLTRYNDALIQARDLLLPRLMVARGEFL